MEKIFYKDEQKTIYVGENLNVKVDVRCGGELVEVEIPWYAIHEIVGYQKSIPLNQRPDITFCPKCKEPIRKAKYEEHLNLCG